MLVFIAALSWSTAGLSTRVVSTDIPTTLFWRSFTGGLCVLAVYIILDRTADLRKLFKIGIGEAVMAVVNAIATICFIASFFHTTIANVVFVSGTMPLITFVFGGNTSKRKTKHDYDHCLCTFCNRRDVHYAGNSKLWRRHRFSFSIWDDHISRPTDGSSQVLSKGRYNKGDLSRCIPRSFVGCAIRLFW